MTSWHLKIIAPRMQPSVQISVSMVAFPSNCMYGCILSIEAWFLFAVKCV